MPEQDEADIQPTGDPQPEAQPLPVESDRLAEVAQPFQVEFDIPPDPTALVLIPAHTSQPADFPLQPELPAGEDTEAEPAAPPGPVKELRRLSRVDRETYDRQRRRFTACSRCGYFIADCQIYLGEEALQSAILASREGWVRLEGDLTFNRLVMNAFGVQLDSEFDYLDGSCPECRRRYVLAIPDDGPAKLKIQV